MKNRQTMAMLLAGVLAVGGITACAKNEPAARGESQATEGTAQAASEETEGKRAESGDRIAIEIVSGDPVELPPEGENFINQALSEAIDADVTFSILGSGNDYSTALNVRITGGDAPDIFAVPAKTDASSSTIINKDSMYQYADNEIIMSISPYLDQLKPMLEFTGAPAEADLHNGQAYLIPIKKTDTVWTANMVRADWLNRVGAEEPKTPEELLEMCKKMTFDDPDGNGKEDTYGMSGPGLKVFNGILYGYGASISNDIQIKDGKVTSSLLSPHMKAGLEMCKAFVDAGVVDPDMVANSSEVADDKAIQGMYGMTNASFAGLMRQSYQDKVHAVNPEAEWKLIDALKGPAGAYCGSRDLSDTQARYVIGKHVEEDPAKMAKIFELLNYLASEAGQRLVCYGAEGVHYNVENGIVAPTDRMASETVFAWAYQIIGRDNEAYLKVKFPEWDELLPYTNTYPRFEVYNSAITPPEGFYMEDFNKYISEEMTKFIYGQRPIDDYDKFLEELESMFGFSDYMKNAEEQLKKYNFIK